MAVAILPSKWKHKPPPGARLNLAHPSVRSMRYCLPFSENGGTSVVNQAYPLTLETAGAASAPTLGTGATWGREGIDFDNSTTAYVDCGDDDGLTGELTIMVRAYLDVVSGLDCLCGDNKTDGSERQVSLYYEANLLSCWVNSVQVLNGATALSALRWYTYALVRSGSTGSWTYTSYIDGRQDDTNTTATNPTTSANGNWRFGFAGAYTGAPWEGPIEFAYLWLRPLAVTEVQDLSLYPYSIFTGPRRRVVSSPAAPPVAQPSRLALLGVGK